jgi:hypothetical protein
MVVSFVHLDLTPADKSGMEKRNDLDESLI